MIELKQPSAAQFEESRRRIKAKAEEQQIQTLIESGFPRKSLKAKPKLETKWLSKFNLTLDWCGSGFIGVIAGRPGTGKTLLATEVARRRKGSSLYTQASIIFRRFADCNKFESPDTEAAILRELWKPVFLVIDEISNREGTEKENRILADILVNRFDAGKDSLLITYHKPAALLDKGSPFKLPSPIIDRISENGEVIEFTWPSFRKRNH